MAIPVTQSIQSPSVEDLQKEFGSPKSSSIAPSTNAPVDWNNYWSKTPSSISTPTPVPEPNLGNQLGQRIQNVGKALTDTLQPKGALQNVVPLQMQMAGEGAGAINDIAGTAISKVGGAAVNAIAPNLPQGAGNAIDKLYSFLHPALQVGAAALQKGGEVYNSWAQANPQDARKMSELVNLAMLGGEGKAAEAVVPDVIKEGLSSAGEAVGNTASALGEKAANVVNPIPESVKTELVKGATEGSIPKQTEIVAKAQDYIDAAKAAVKDNSKPSPLELAGNKAEEALSKINDQLKQFGKAKDAALAEKATSPVNLQEAYNAFGKNLEDKLGTVTTPKGDLISAPNRVSSVVGNSADEKLVNMANNAIGILKHNPTLQQVNDLVDNLQNEIYKSKQVGAIPLNSKTEAVIKSFTHDLNEAAKTVGGDAYRAANKNYSDLVGTRDTLNKALGTDANKGASLMKQLFSPNATMQRNLFSEIKNRTGIDLVNEATLAKHAMEVAGDTRQKSLLQEVIGGATNPSSIPERLIKAAAQKLSNPETRTINIAKKGLKTAK